MLPGLPVAPPRGVAGPARARIGLGHPDTVPRGLAPSYTGGLPGSATCGNRLTGDLWAIADPGGMDDTCDNGGYQAAQQAGLDTTLAMTARTLARGLKPYAGPLAPVVSTRQHVAFRTDATRTEHSEQPASVPRGAGEPAEKGAARQSGPGRTENVVRLFPDRPTMADLGVLPPPANVLGPIGPGSSLTRRDAADGGSPVHHLPFLAVPFPATPTPARSPMLLSRTSPGRHARCRRTP